MNLAISISIILATFISTTNPPTLVYGAEVNIADAKPATGEELSSTDTEFHSTTDTTPDTAEEKSSITEESTAKQSNEDNSEPEKQVVSGTSGDNADSNELLAEKSDTITTSKITTEKTIDDNSITERHVVSNKDKSSTNGVIAETSSRIIEKLGDKPDSTTETSGTSTTEKSSITLFLIIG